MKRGKKGGWYHLVGKEFLGRPDSVNHTYENNTAWSRKV